MVEPMVSSSHFQSQLASIMEMLAKTAVLEIGKLVEENHVVFKRELSRRITENESLKNKCELLESELRASRRSAQKIAELLHNAKSAASTTAHKDVVHRPTIDGVFGKEWCMDLWKDKEPVAAQLSQGQVDPCVIEVGVSAGVRLCPCGRLDDRLFCKHKATCAEVMLKDDLKSIDLMDDDGPEMIIINDETLERVSNKHKLQADAVRSNEKGQALPSMESGVDQSNDDFITYTIPTDNMPQRSASDPTINPRPSTLEDASTSSNITIDEFGAFYPSNVHINSGTNLAGITEPKKFGCVFCGKNFNYLSYLKVHLRTHSGEKPFACSVCGKRFAQKPYLKIHMRTHSGERPYSCMECSKSFSQKSSLNIHLRSHTGEKPYSCVDCGKRYTYKHGFNIHQCNS